MRRDYRDRFDEYFQDRAGWLRRLGFALSGDWHLAEDLTQTTFIRLYRAWSRIDVDSIDAYARRTMVNAFLSDCRKRRESPTADLPEQEAVGSDVDSRLALHQALRALPPAQRAVVVLRYLEDLSVAEVGTLLGVSQGTVKSQTARAIAAMQANMVETLR
jgi:RNA polymerase sigma-70 factor (sigma-E family)